MNKIIILTYLCYNRIECKCLEIWNHFRMTIEAIHPEALHILIEGSNQNKTQHIFSYNRQNSYKSMHVYLQSFPFLLVVISYKYFRNSVWKKRSFRTHLSVEKCQFCSNLNVFLLFIFISFLRWYILVLVKVNFLFDWTIVFRWNML